MVSRVFVTALSLVSALAQALVYGLGGYLAVTGATRAGDGRHARAAAHPALHADDGAGERPRRRDVGAGAVRAGVRGPRPPAVDHRAPDPAPLPGRRGVPARRAVRLPGAERVSLASLEDVAVLDPRGNDEVLHGIDLEVAGGRCSRWSARRARGSRRSPRSCPALRRRLRCGGAVRGGRARPVLRRAPPCGRRRDPGRAPVPRHDPGQPRYAAPATDDELVDALHRAGLGDLLAGCPTGWTRWSASAATAVRRGAPAPRRSPGCCSRAPGGDPRRGHCALGLRVRGRGAGGAGGGAGRADRDRDRAPAVHGPGGGPIAVVERGRVVERGTHDELLGAGGRYAALLPHPVRAGRADRRVDVRQAAWSRPRGR